MKEISLEELKKLELDILTFVADFCDRNGIVYYLCGGTMLGALRHNGFIPWDDDIDIMLMRKDYERLISEFPKHDYYKVIDNRIDNNYPFAFATVNDIRTYKKENKLRKRYTKCLCVNVDVFPIDTVPTNDKDIKTFFDKVARQGNKLKCATDCYGQGVGIWGTIRKNIAIFIFRCMELLRFQKPEDIVEQFRILAQSHNEEDSPYCGITSIAHYGAKEVNPKDNYGVVKHQFEDKEFNIISGYDRYLSQLYGNDYMSLPPEEKRRTHHASNCYWRL